MKIRLTKAELLKYKKITKTVIGRLFRHIPNEFGERYDFYLQNHHSNVSEKTEQTAFNKILELPRSKQILLLDFATNKAGLTKKQVIKLIKEDKDIPKATIKKVVKLGSRRVARFLVQNQVAADYKI